MTGAGLAGASLLGAAGCGGSASSFSPGAEMWKQFSGTTLNFVSENTAPTTAIAANLNGFKELTGINVNVLQLELGALVQKVALDIGSGREPTRSSTPTPTRSWPPTTTRSPTWASSIDDDNLPSVPKGTDDFIPTQLAAAGRFENEQNLYALPYDCPTMIWMYRKDLFDKYGDQMSQDLGFDPKPSPSLTWEQYYQIADWFNENQDEVPYGTGHQARQYDSLMCDFSNILWAYGGDYFDSKEIGSLGTANPGPCTLDEPRSVGGRRVLQETAVHRASGKRLVGPRRAREIASPRLWPPPVTTATLSRKENSSISSLRSALQNNVQPPSTRRLEPVMKPPRSLYPNEAVGSLKCAPHATSHPAIRTELPTPRRRGCRR